MLKFYSIPYLKRNRATTAFLAGTASSLWSRTAPATAWGTPIRRSAKTDAAGRRPFCLRSPAAGAAPCFPCRFLPKPLAFWAGFAIIFSLLGAAAVRGARRSSESRAGRAEKAARLTF